MPPTLSVTEVVAITGLDERRVRKDVEYGFFGASSPPRFDLPAIVYFRAVAELGFELGVDDRRTLHLRIRDALRAKAIPSRLALSAITDLKLGALVREVKRRLERFGTWKAKLVVDDDILGGEPVFAKSRLAVRRIGGMLLRGASPDEVKEDYPYLDDEDLVFAKQYAVAYPRVGRPREASAR
jgi:uncharacterized protein (DUF433 family)